MVSSDTKCESSESSTLPCISMNKDSDCMTEGGGK